MSTVNVHVLGKVGVTRSDTEIGLQPGLRQLLALLVAAGPSGATLDWLADETWGEELPATWQASMRMAVSRLRKWAALSVPIKNGRYRLELGESQVDAWVLLSAQHHDRPWSTDLEPLITEPRIFPSIEISPALHTAVAEIDAAQRWAIEKLSRKEVRHRRSLLASLNRRVRDDPLDAGLCCAVARIHARGGDRSEALALIELCREAHRKMPSEPPTELDDLAGEVRSGTISTVPADDTANDTDQPPEPSLPFHLGRSRANTFVGRGRELDLLCQVIEPDGPSVVIVRGEPGDGKTSLLAEAGHQLAAAGAYLVFVTGSADSRIGLSPLTAGVPGFGTLVAETAADPEQDSATRLGGLAGRLLDLLVEKASGRRTVVIVDDAQWLDGSTCGIIDLLARASTGDYPVAVVIAARATPEPRSPWAGLQAQLSRLPYAANLSLEPLAEAHIADIVAARRPHETFAARRQMTAWLHRASGGNPAVAHALLTLDDPDTTTASTEAEVFDRLVRTIDTEPRQICAKAAVLGHRFRLPDLAALLDKGEDELLEALAAAIDEDLLIETGSLDVFEFAHQLVSEAFLRSLPTAQRVRLHRDACRLTTNVHELSRHCSAAAGLLGSKQAIEAVLASARAHLTDRSYWEAAAEFRVALGLSGKPPGDDLDAAAYVDFARAVSLSGARGASVGVRAKAYNAAVQAGDWALAHDAAISGLPEAEVPDGEDDRREQLAAIRPDDLDPRRRLTQALWSARLASQLGDPDDAQDWARRAKALATTDQERVETALVERLAAMANEPPPDRLDRLDTAVEGLGNIGDRSRCLLAQVRAIDRLEQGELGAAAEALATFERLADAIADPLRRWHACVFKSLLHEIDGQWAAADQLAGNARRLGHRFAIAQAEIVYRGHEYFRLDLTGHLGRLAPLIDDVPHPDAESLLFNASRARVLLAGGRRDEAIDVADEVTRRVLDQPSVSSLSCLAFVVPPLAQHPSTELRVRARAALGRFGPSFVVVGVGLGLLGPLNLLASMLDDGADDHQHRIHSLRQAIKVCDTANIRSLQVRYRLDLAELSGNPALLVEARQLAEGTSLVALTDLGPT